MMASDVQKLLSSSIQCFLANLDTSSQDGLRINIAVMFEDEKLCNIFKAKKVSMDAAPSEWICGEELKTCTKCNSEFNCLDHKLHLTFHFKDCGDECSSCLSATRPSEEVTTPKNRGRPKKRGRKPNTPKKFVKTEVKTEEKVVPDQVEDVAVLEDVAVVGSVRRSKRTTKSRFRKPLVSSKNVVANDDKENSSDNDFHCYNDDDEAYDPDFPEEPVKGEISEDEIAEEYSITHKKECVVKDDSSFDIIIKNEMPDNAVVVKTKKSQRKSDKFDADAVISGTNDGFEGVLFQKASENERFSMLGNVILLSPNHKSDIVVNVFSCNICNATFPVKRYLTRHSTKMNLDPIGCDLCEAVFHTVELKDQHHLAHDGVNPFMCLVCYQSFPVLRQAKRHAIKHLEPHERPFICQVCGKGFIAHSNYNEHMSLHAEVKPYHCTECDAKFSIPTRLNSHMRQHSGVTYTCQTCKKIYKTYGSLSEHLAVYKDHYSNDKYVPIQKVAQLTKEKKSEDSPARKRRKSFYQLKDEAEIRIENDDDELDNIEKGDESVSETNRDVTPFPKQCLDLIVCNNKNEDTIKLPTNPWKTAGLKRQKYVCTVCCKSYAQNRQLLRHYRTYGKLFYHCRQCRCKFHSKRERDQHSLFHKGPNSYMCTVCGKSFEFLSKCVRHTSNHLPTKLRPFPCKKCGKSFSSRSHLKIHSWTHYIDNPFICPECGMNLPTETRLRLHMNVHKSPGLTCDTCGRKYKHMSSLRDHITRTKHASKDMTSERNTSDNVAKEVKKTEVICNICGVLCRSTAAHIRHLMCHDRSAKLLDESSDLHNFAYDKYLERVKLLNDNLKENNNKPSRQGMYLCTSCGQEFKLRGSYYRHVNIKHGSPRHICCICGKGFFRLSQYKEHMASHEGGPMHKCTICSKAFYGKRNLVKHISRHDKSTYLHTCDVCGTSFQFESFLKTHMRKHTGEKPYKCNVCSKEMACKYTLNKHMIIHGEKTHFCDVCEKAFSTVHGLRSHLRSHAGEMVKFQCQFCPKAFMAKTRLRHHHKTRHPGTKFMCEEKDCTQTFYTIEELKKHRSKHTLGQNFTCEFCHIIYESHAALTAHMETHDASDRIICTNIPDSEIIINTCSACSQVFTIKCPAKDREKYEAKIKCPTCEKEVVFSSEINYVVDKSHVCMICSRTFKSLEFLESHLGVHTGERPFECQLCGKAFAATEEHDKHRTMMHGAKLECDVCGQGFNTRYALTKHHKLHLIRIEVAEDAVVSTMPVIKIEHVNDNLKFQTEVENQHDILDKAISSITVDGQEYFTVPLETVEQPVIAIESNYAIQNIAEQVVISSIDRNEIVMVAMAPDASNILSLNSHFQDS